MQHITALFCTALFWYVSIKNDFVAQLHKFMASLTDTRWKMDGKTVLYIPHEGTVVPVSPTTAKNKELIHRLESRIVVLVIIHAFYMCFGDLVITN